MVPSNEIQINVTKGDDNIQTVKEENEVELLRPQIEEALAPKIAGLFGKDTVLKLNADAALLAQLEA